MAQALKLVPPAAVRAEHIDAERIDPDFLGVEVPFLMALDAQPSIHDDLRRSEGQEMNDRTNTAKDKSAQAAGAMSKLSREDIQKIDTELSFPFGCIVLRCDGNTVTIQVQRTKPRRYDLMVYVNGWFKGEYLKEGAPEHRFYRPVKISAYKPSERAKIEKNFGKRKARKYFPNLDKTSTYYMPSWNTPSTMLRHFARVCQSVTLVSVGVVVNTSVDTTAPEVAHV